MCPRRLDRPLSWPGANHFSALQASSTTEPGKERFPLAPPQPEARSRQLWVCSGCFFSQLQLLDPAALAFPLGCPGSSWQLCGALCVPVSGWDGVNSVPHSSRGAGLCEGVGNTPVQAPAAPTALSFQCPPHQHSGWAGSGQGTRPGQPQTEPRDVPDQVTPAQVQKKRERRRKGGCEKGFMSYNIRRAILTSWEGAGHHLRVASEEFKPSGFLLFPFPCAHVPSAFTL